MLAQSALELSPLLPVRHRLGFPENAPQIEAIAARQALVDRVRGQQGAVPTRDAIMNRPAEPGPPRLVLIGYSKGAPDILEAMAAYPELRSRVAAVVSAAGSVGGSPLANDAERYQADLLRHFPGATCTSGDGGAVASLRPAVRQAWLACRCCPAKAELLQAV
jgi:dienelactone hydrolase